MLAAAFLSTAPGWAVETHFAPFENRLWGDGGNWTAGVPNSSTDAYLNERCTLALGIGNAQNTLIGAGGNGRLYADQTTLSTGLLTLGRDAGNVGEFELDRSVKLYATTGIVVGLHGTGILKVGRGSKLELNPNCELAVHPNSQGTMIIGSSASGEAPLEFNANITGGAGTAAVVFQETPNYFAYFNMRGNLRVDKTGSTVVTLLGANTYTGGTNVNAGTLRGHTGSLQGDIANNATVVFLQETDGTYAGNMNGTGSFIKANSGALTLTGNHSAFTGSTSVLGGTLMAKASSLPLNINNSTLVIVDQVANGNYAGVISGTGSVAKTGMGELTISTVQTHTGGTAVYQGTLILDGTVPIGVGLIRKDLTIENDATVIARVPNALGYNNTDVKVNTVTINGGTFKSTANQDQGWGVNYILNGGHMISNANAPVISLNDPTTPSRFAFGNHTSVTVKGAADSFISGRIDLRRDFDTNVNFTVEGTGHLKIAAAITNTNGVVGVTKLGPGTMEINGPGHYQGATHVNEGTLAVGPGGSIEGNGGIVGDVHVAAGATLVADGPVNGDLLIHGTLTGSASTGPVTVAPGGTLAPQNFAGGRFEVESLNLQAGSGLLIDFGRPDFSSDVIFSHGTVDLAGNLHINLGANVFPGSNIWFLGSDLPISTRFANVDHDLPWAGELIDHGRIFAVNYLGDNPSYAHSVSVTYIGPVPEPGSALLLLLGATALATRRRHSSRR